MASTTVTMVESGEQAEDDVDRRRSTELAKGQGSKRGSKADDIRWQQYMRQYFPRLQKKTYFIPPLHFRRAFYEVTEVAGQSVLVLQKPKPGKTYHRPKSCDDKQESQDEPVASQAWLDVPSNLYTEEYDKDAVREDDALQTVLEYIGDKAKKDKDVMMVLSKLNFRKYLDSQEAPIAAARQCIGGANQPGVGASTLTIISKLHGLFVAEVCGIEVKQENDQKELKKALRKLVAQFDTVENELCSLLSKSNIKAVNIHKVLVFPNVTSQQLKEVLDEDEDVSKSLCERLSLPAVRHVVEMCLCEDNKESADWWLKIKSNAGPDKNMTPELYQTIATLLCVPSAVVKVPLLPCSTGNFPSLGEAVAEAGRRIALITLYPEQIHLVNAKGLFTVFLTGPPGTGKTLVLNVKGMQWMRKGHNVHVVSTWERSMAATFLIQHQLSRAREAGARQSEPGTVKLHLYNLQQKGEVEKAVNELSQEAQGEELYVIADEAGPDEGHFFSDFSKLLNQRVKKLRLWAAAVKPRQIPDIMQKKLLTIPLRCPPTVVREVKKAAEFREGKVERYARTAVPPPTLGPRVKWLYHCNQERHCDGLPQDCEACAENIHGVLMELEVGQEKKQDKQALEYRDVLILCSLIREEPRFVTHLKSENFPVTVLTDTKNEDAIKNVALARNNEITVAYTHTIYGLERRVVFWIGPVEAGRLESMSRCTSQLVVVGQDNPPLDNSDDEEISSSDESTASTDTGYDSGNLTRSVSDSEFTDTVGDKGLSELQGSNDDGSEEVDRPVLDSAGKRSTNESENGEKTESSQAPRLTRLLSVESDAETEIIKQPVFSKRWQFEGEFSKEGGHLRGENSDFILTVPEGAINEGSTVVIRGAVYTDLETVHKKLGLGENECIVSPFVEYTAVPNIVFNKPLTISIPHFIPGNASLSEVAVYSSEGDQHQKLTPQQYASASVSAHTETATDVFHFQGQGPIKVYVRHFTGFVCTVCRSERHVNQFRLRLYASHSTINHTTEVNIVLLVWDGRLEITDMRANIGVDDQHFKMCKTLDPPADQTGLSMGFQLLLNEAELEAWMFCPEPDEENDFLTRSVERLSLERYPPNCLKCSWKRIDWNLQNNHSLGPGAHFTCYVYAGFVATEKENFNSKDLVNKEKLRAVEHLVGPARQFERHDESEQVVKRVLENSTMEKLFFDVVSLRNTEVYPMQQIVRGVLLIISNESFEIARQAGHRNLQDREGTRADVKALQDVFRQLRFKIILEEDCTAEELLSALKHRLNNNHSDYDCFACAILSHGKRDSVLGVDGRSVPLQTLWSAMGRGHSSLNGKPKLLFIQACQGDQPNRGTTEPDSPVMEEPDVFPIPHEEAAETQEELQGAAGGEIAQVATPGDLSVDIRNDPPQNLPEAGKFDTPQSRALRGSDLFFAEATIPGHLSYRDPVEGTWFIKALTTVFAKHSHDTDIVHLMVKTRNYVSRETTPEGDSQQSMDLTTLSKTLYFFPGLVCPRDSPSNSASRSGATPT